MTGQRPLESNQHLLERTVWAAQSTRTGPEPNLQVIKDPTPLEIDEAAAWPPRSPRPPVQVSKVTSAFLEGRAGPPNRCTLVQSPIPRPSNILPQRTPLETVKAAIFAADPDVQIFHQRMRNCRFGFHRSARNGVCVVPKTLSSRGGVLRLCDFLEPNVAQPPVQVLKVTNGAEKGRCGRRNRRAWVWRT